MTVLDTHAWIWLVSSPEMISEDAMDLIDSAKRNDGVLISSFSVWEVYMLVKRHRLVLDRPADIWINLSEKLSYFRFVSVDNQIAALSVNLPGVFHPDPADRIITATALCHGATIITKDEKILNYEHVKSCW